MAKTKAKQIGEVASGLALESTAISYYQTNPTDYQIAPVAAPALLVAETTPQDLVMVADEPVVADLPVVLDPDLPDLVLDPITCPNYPNPSILIDPPVVANPPVIIVDPNPFIVDSPLAVEPSVVIDPPVAVDLNVIRFNWGDNSDDPYFSPIDNFLFQPSNRFVVGDGWIDGTSQADIIMC